ncbi:MAG: sensor histidine kinase, partial [Planctomycetaceae bacterium]
MDTVADSARRPGLLAFWGAHAAFWAVAFAANVLLAAVFAVDDPWGVIALESGLCFTATAAMRALSRREQLLIKLGVSKAGLLAGGMILSAVLIALMLLASRPSFGLPAATRPELVARLAITFAMLATWCAFYFGFQLIGDGYLAEIRALQAESLALRHELKHLQAQISPHFLFNALNTVMAHRHDPEAIETVTQALANYLYFLL